MTTSIERDVASLSDDLLLMFLQQQRWFGAKGAEVANVRVDRLVVLPWGEGEFGIARVTVDVGGAPRTYQLPIAARRALPPNIPASAVIVDGSATGTGPAIYDAVHDPDFRRGLTHTLNAGAAVAGQTGGRWLVTPIGAKKLTTSALATSRVGSAEQSNTSIIIDDQIILKLFRMLTPGIQPDVEVTRFLTTRAGFAGTPALLAVISFEDNGALTTAGMAQAYLPGSTDAWSYAHERARYYFGAPEHREAPNLFLEDAKELGQITRAMHDALASDDEDPAFAPEPVAPEDLDRWAHRTAQSIRDTLALLERRIESPDFPADRLEEAKALVQRRDHYLGWTNEIADNIGDDLGMCSRVHGDYHLGQVLRPPKGDFRIIDFEGEPARSLEERREKTSPLRDVAGMVRSIAYAAATLAMEAKNVQPQTREVRAGRWERDVRAAFLSGYLEAPNDENLLPDEEAHTRQLMSLFEMEKAFYELSYELNNRPSWAWIPMRGIAKLATRAAP